MSPAVPTRRPLMTHDVAALAIALAAAFGGWLVVVGTVVGQTLTDPSVIEPRDCRDGTAPPTPRRPADAGVRTPPATAAPAAPGCRRTP